VTSLNAKSPEAASRSIRSRAASATAKSEPRTMRRRFVDDSPIQREASVGFRAGWPAVSMEHISLGERP